MKVGGTILRLLTFFAIIDGKTNAAAAPIQPVQAGAGDMGGSGCLCALPPPPALRVVRWWSGPNGLWGEFWPE